MSVKLAMSTLACPDWTIQQVADMARQWGYDGVDLRTLGTNGHGDETLASDPVVVGAEKVREVLDAAGLSPACLSTSVALHHRHPLAAERAMQQGRSAIELAQAMRCPWVRVYGYEIEPGESRDQGQHRIADRVRELAEYAAPKGVGVLLENAGNLATARDWWTIMDLIDQPNAGMSWNQQVSMLAGEGAGVSVPMLHGLIRLARLKDMVTQPQAMFVMLGDGQMKVRETLHRLLGVGFDGWLVVEWDKLWLPGLMEAQAYLPEAGKRVKDWIQAIGKAQETAKPKPKPVAHAAAAKG